MSLFQSKSFYLGLLTALLASTAATSIAATGFSPKALPFAQGEVSIQEDSGDSQSISDVKSSIIHQFESLQKLALIPAETQKAIGGGADFKASANLLDELKSIWVEKSAIEAHKKLVELYAAESGKFPEPTWSGVSVIIEKWQGVQVSGSTATALFESHTQYADGSTEWADATVQWNVSLELDQDSNVWKLVERTGNRIEN